MCLANAYEPTNGRAAGAWIAPRLRGAFGAVTLTVPTGYDAYARIFHPAYDERGIRTRWSDVAHLIGTVPHPIMQWHSLVRSTDPANFAGSKWLGTPPRRGKLAVADLAALFQILDSHTTRAATIYVGFCTIFEATLPFRINQFKDDLLSLPFDREYVVFERIRSAADRPTIADFSTASSALSRRELAHQDAPNLIWPSDHSWLVATDVDYDSTLIGGSRPLIDTILSAPTLEGLEIGPTDSLASDADNVNSTSDEEEAN